MTSLWRNCRRDCQLLASPGIPRPQPPPLSTPTPKASAPNIYVREPVKYKLPISPQCGKVRPSSSSARLPRNIHPNSCVISRVDQEPSSQLLPRAGCAAGTTMAVSGPPPGRLPQISYLCSMSSSSATMTCSLSQTETAPTPTPSSPNGACACHYLSPPTVGTAQPSSSTASPNHSPPIPPSKSILPAQATFSPPPSSSISTSRVTPAKP